MNPARPIEIIGGGLAGLSLGLALRRAGVLVQIFEAGGYPRHRVCGEFIAGLAPTTAARLGLVPFLSDALRHREVGWFVGGRLKQQQRLPTPALGLSRYRLDARLARAFVVAGGKLHTASRVVDRPAAPGLVMATGRRRAASPWLGLKIHVRNLRLLCDLEVHLGTAAYVGMSRVEEGRVNVCGLFRRQSISAKGPALLLAYLRATGLGALASQLAGADFDPESFCAVAAVGFDQHVPAAAGVEVGDACVMIPPFTGNGMAMAFQSAESALDPLIAYGRDALPWPEACQAIRQALHKRFQLRLAAADLLHPFLLQPPRQRWLTRLARAHLLPLRPLYTVLH